MGTVLKLNTHNALVLPGELRDDDVRYSDALVEYFVGHYTIPGDVVFDPFAGFGTTLYIAEKLGRRAFGVELLPERAAFIKANLKEPNGILCGSSLRLDEMDLPEIDFVLTSPPYMQRVNHPEYPFAGYTITGQGYADYLRDVADVFGQLKKRLKPGAHAVIEASNLRIDGAFTPLAWDIARSVDGVLAFQREMIIDWESDGSPVDVFGYTHSYALLFQNKEG